MKLLRRKTDPGRSLTEISILVAALLVGLISFLAGPPIAGPASLCDEGRACVVWP